MLQILKLHKNWQKYVKNAFLWPIFIKLSPCPLMPQPPPSLPPPLTPHLNFQFLLQMKELIELHNSGTFPGDKHCSSHFRDH